MLALLLSGCAPVLSESRTVNTLAALQITQRAGVIPLDWSVSGDSHTAHYARLLTWADHEGIVVAAAPISSKNLLGHASRGLYVGWVILINERLPPNNRLYTLLHELGHVLGPSDLTPEQGETIAELVAVQVCADVGLQVDRQTAAYLLTYVPIVQQSWTVQQHGKAIDAIVVTLSKAVRGA